MRRLVAFERVSADGCFTDAHGGIEWVPQDPELDRAGAGALEGTGAILFGRKTYDGFESFWPKVIDESPTAPAPHGPARRSADLRAMGAWINGAEKLVFSRTRTRSDWHNSHFLGEFSPEKVRELKARPGKAIMIFGSGELVTQLTAHRLIDEYLIVVAPLVLGGRALFGPLAHAVPLKFEEATPFPSGNVRLRYSLAP